MGDVGSKIGKVLRNVGDLLDPDSKPGPKVESNSNAIVNITVPAESFYRNNSSPEMAFIPAHEKPSAPILNNANIHNGIYAIQNKGSGLYVEISNGEKYDGAVAVIHRWTQKNSQVFAIKRRSDGTYAITAVHSRKMLEVENSARNTGAYVQQGEWSGADNQRWIISDCGDGWYKLTAKHSGYIFDVAGGGCAAGTHLQQAEGNDCPAQRFRFITNYDVIPSSFADVTNRWGNKRISLKSMKNDNYVVANVDANGFPLQARTRNANLRKIFETCLTPEGHIIFHNMQSKKFVKTNISEHNAPLTAKADNVSRQEYFRIFTDGHAFYLRSVANGCWVSADIYTTNAPIVANASEPSGWERFEIVAHDE